MRLAEEFEKDDITGVPLEVVAGAWIRKNSNYGVGSTWTRAFG